MTGSAPKDLFTSLDLPCSSSVDGSVLKESGSEEELLRPRKMTYP